MESVLNVFGVLFVGGLYSFMWISGNYCSRSGLFYTYYSRICKRARAKSILPVILGNIGCVATVVTFTLLATDTVMVTTGMIIFGMFVPTALGWSAFGGFNFDLTGIED